MHGYVHWKRYLPRTPQRGGEDAYQPPLIFPVTPGRAIKNRVMKYEDREHDVGGDTLKVCLKPLILFRADVQAHVTVQDHEMDIFYIYRVPCFSSWEVEVRNKHLSTPIVIPPGGIEFRPVYKSPGYLKGHLPLIRVWTISYEISRVEYRPGVKCHDGSDDPAMSIMAISRVPIDYDAPLSGLSME